MSGKDETNSVIISAEIANLALSIDKGTMKDFPDKAKKKLDKITELAKALEKAKDPHKDDPRIKYDSPKFEELEKRVQKVVFDPKRGSQTWFNNSWPVIAEYLKAVNVKLFRNL